MPRNFQVDLQVVLQVDFQAGILKPDFRGSRGANPMQGLQAFWGNPAVSAPF
jgi:hypothetical protein